MCVLRKKLILTDAIIDRLVTVEMERLQAKAKTEGKSDLKIVKEDVIGKFTAIRVMKLLYFICLRSLVNGNMDRDHSLFAVYDNFIADTYGPVEIDTYRNRALLPRYTFEDGFLRRKDLTETAMYANLLKVFPLLHPVDVNGEIFENEGREGLENEVSRQLIELEELGGWETMAEEAISLLEEENVLSQPTMRLVDLTHQLPLWKQAQKAPENKMDTNNPFSLLKEILELNNLKSSYLI